MRLIRTKVRRHILTNHLSPGSDQSFEFGAVVHDHTPNCESAHNAESECHDITGYLRRQTCRFHPLDPRLLDREPTISPDGARGHVQVTVALVAHADRQIDEKIIPAEEN